MKKTFFILFLVLSPVIALAGTGIVPCGGPDEKACTFCDFFVMLDRIIKFFLIPDQVNGGLPMVPILAVLMIVIAGFLYIISYSGGLADLGEGKKGGPALIGQAKKIISSVVAGLFIVYGAWLIINAFFWIIGAKNAGSWNQIQCSFLQIIGLG